MLLESDSGNIFFAQPSPVLLLQTVDRASSRQIIQKNMVHLHFNFFTV
jgi:hypothetical protein